MINLYGACVRVGKAMGYKRIITYTLESEHGSNVRAANFKYDGIAGGIVWSGERRNDALPGGDMKEVFETVKTNNYMGWKPCTMEEARAAANNGTAAIGISDTPYEMNRADYMRDPTVEPTKSNRTWGKLNLTVVLSPILPIVITELLWFIPQFDIRYL